MNDVSKEFVTYWPPTLTHDEMEQRKMDSRKPILCLYLDRHGKVVYDNYNGWYSEEDRLRVEQDCKDGWHMKQGIWKKTKKESDETEQRRN